MAKEKHWLECNRKEIVREKKQLKEAVEVLESLLEWLEKVAKPRMQYKRIRSALRMAIVALERATPKEVLETHCPVCGRLVAFRHCERCGQRLEW